MNYEQAKETIKTGISCLDYLEKAPRSGYICPECGSGTGAHKTGAVRYYDDTNTWYCHACGKGGDVIDLAQIRRGTDYKEAFTFLAERMDLHIDQTRRSTAADDFADEPKENTPQKEKTPETGAQSKTEAPAADFTDYYKECRERLNDPAALAYLQTRGISQTTAAKYWIGYDPAADPAGAPGATGNQYKAHPLPRLIIPTTAGHYVARSIDPNTPAAFQKMNPKGSTPGLFNAKALHAQEVQELFVCEGVFDALAIIEAGFSAIALNSTSNADAFIEELKEARPAAPLVLALDNDDAGQKAADKIRQELPALEIPFLVANIAGEEKDAGDLWTKDPAALKRNCMKARRELGGPCSTSEYLAHFFEAERADFNAEYKTGFPQLDEETGGLYAGLYVIAALSSLGKTTFSIQLADQLAEQGADVLFFSLEQSTLEVVAKSIARQTAIDSMKTRHDTADAVNALAIRKGADSKPVRIAVQEYRNKVKDHVQVLEGNFSCNVDMIRQTVRQHIERTGRRPVVFLDYLQILQPTPAMARAGTREALDASITELKRITRDYNITLFAISSVNRSNYLTPIAFESLKETGAIEFTADCIYGLQYACLDEDIFNEKEKIKVKRERIAKAKAEDPRKIQLKCLKNRYGRDFKQTFLYYPAFDLFEEADDFKEPLQPLPEDINTI